MAIYYIDSRQGSDTQDGRTPQTAWASLDALQSLRFQPGDRLCLACGSRWEGSLAPLGSGAPGNPCVIESYGRGPRPRIDGQGRVFAAVLLHNTQGWVVRGLEVTNTGAEPSPRRIGILIHNQNHGTCRDFVIEDNYVHDVNGSNVKAEGPFAVGIAAIAEGEDPPSNFDGITISRNHLVRCDRVGIYISGLSDRRKWFPSLHVVIYGNLLEDIGGDGILNIATDGCVVERNRLLGARMRDDRYCAGIWPWGADHTRIRYNEAAYCRGTRDGQGFDSDDDCIGTIHEYNYSHDNEGGYMLVCTVAPPEMLPYQPHNAGCIATHIYRNLSVNDCLRTFHLAGPVVGTTIQENCVYVGRGMDVAVFQYTGAAETLGPPETTVIARNIFASRGTARYVEAVDRLEDGTFTQRPAPNPTYARFTGNAFLGSHENPPHDDGRPIPAPPLEELEAVLLDENGRAKPGLETLDAFLDLMGWPKR